MTDATLRPRYKNTPFVSSIGLSFSRLLTYLKINPERSAAIPDDNFKILSSGPQKHLLILVYVHTYIRTYVHTYIHTHTNIHTQRGTYKVHPYPRGAS